MQITCYYCSRELYCGHDRECPYWSSMPIDTAKKTNEELIDMLRGPTCPMPGTAWRHYKTGNIYRVTGSAILEATQTPLVIYRNMDGGVTFARPVSEWREEVIHPDGNTGPRFTKV